MINSLVAYLRTQYVKLNKFQFDNENKANLLLNHLAVAYIFFISFTPHGYAVSFIFTLLYIIILLRGNYIKYLKISLSNPITLPFLLFMCIHYIWYFIGTNDLDAGKDTLKYSHYLLYPFFFFLFLDQRFYTRLLTSFLAGVMISTFLSYLIQFNIIPREFIIDGIQVPWKETGNLLKIIFYSSINGEPAPFLEHSWYSILLATTSSLLFYKLFHSKSLYFKIIYFVFFIIISINLFFIGGRIGYLLYALLFLTNIFIIIKHYTSRKYISIILFLPIILVFIMYEAGGLFHKRVDLTISGLKTINNTKHNIDGSFSERFLMAKAGLEIVPKNFLFGIGTGDQKLVLRSKPENVNNPIQHHRDIHNQHIDMFMQFGFLGFLFYLYLFYAAAKFKAGTSEKNSLKLLILVSMIITGFFGSFWHFLPILFTMLIIITSSNMNIIMTEIKQSKIKTVIGYTLMILLSYSIEQLQ